VRVYVHDSQKRTVLFDIVNSNEEIALIINCIYIWIAELRGFGKNLHAEFRKWPQGIYDFYDGIPESQML